MRHFAPALLALLALTACDDGDDANPAPIVDAQVDAAETEADATIVDMAIVDMSAPQLDMAPAHFDMAVEADMAPPAPLCGEALCFSNRDCPDAATVCLVDPNDDARSCCQPGARGADPAGTPCGDDGERTCATAVCIEGDAGRFCSGVCDTEEDCPANMQRCFGLGIDGNVEGWCLPTD